MSTKVNLPNSNHFNHKHIIVVFNLLHNGLSSGQSFQFLVVFNHFVLTANG